MHHNHNTEITHCGATAPVALWKALYRLSHAPDGTVTIHGPLIYRSEAPDLDALIYRGRAVTGCDDWRAVVWATSEYERAIQEIQRIAATRREAEAIDKLAAAIRSEADQAVLERVLSRLTNRTQYAVRAQLEGTHWQSAAE